jgi:hypothetical protein
MQVSASFIETPPIERIGAPGVKADQQITGKQKPPQSGFRKCGNQKVVCGEDDKCRTTELENAVQNSAACHN